MRSCAKPTLKSLADAVEISRQFLRSVRLDADYGREDALCGYVLQASGQSALEAMARQIQETQQRAFTWTGPYGGGKSSLALALCSLVHAEGKVRKVARMTLGLGVDNIVLKAFNAGRDGWAVLPIVGKRALVQEEIGRAIGALTGRRRSGGLGRRFDAIADLVNLAQSTRCNGVLVVIDELGKFLEHTAQAGNDDVYFYQELAEAASRTRGKLVVAGILHQAFEQYAVKLGREARDEWAKVQGRYVDIPIVAAVDEVIELTGRAIEVHGVKHAESRAVAKAVSDCIRRHRPGIASDLDCRMDACWPLHPITAALLGPSAKRRFGQNERSIFGFLGSVEPLGFRDFLSNREIGSLAYYWPDQYWDYLQANLESSILASPDGHRWALGTEAVERAEARGEALHVRLAKTIALVEMFRNGSGVLAEDELLRTCVPGGRGDDVRKALADLARWSIVIYRKHLSAWGIYAGSDFDIDAAVRNARGEIGEDDLKRLSKISDLYPVLAKRFYQETGTMRWFTRSIVRAEDVERYARNHCRVDGSSGEFLLVIPQRGMSLRAADSLARKVSALEGVPPLVVGIPRNAERLVELGEELTALEKVYTSSPELQGDGVARREIDARIGYVRAELEETLRDAFTLACWFYQGEPTEISSGKGLSPVASAIAAQLYPNTPHIFSEIINRDNLSSNSVKARRNLLHCMLTHAHLDNLGYEGFPADAGLYYTVLKATGLHQVADRGWRFGKPTGKGRAESFKLLWEATDQLVTQPGRIVALDQVYRLWTAPPYGMKKGALPILALAYFLANRRQLAVYIDGTFTPDLSEAHIDEWLQDPSRIAWRFVHMAGSQRRMLESLANSVTEHLGRSVIPEALDSARALVALTVELPPWTKRTLMVSERAQSVRQLLLKASDPHKVLVTDLPALLEKEGGYPLADAVGATLAELVNAFPKMLRMVEGKLFQAIDHHGDLERLRHRGTVVAGITGDFRLDAFAGRIANYRAQDVDIEGLIALAVNKPFREWNDRDVDAGILQIGSWALGFRRTETLASLKGRPSLRRAFAVVFGTGDNNKTVSGAFDVAEDDTPAIRDLVNKILAQRVTGAVRTEVFLAALAEAGALLVEQTGQSA